MSDGQEHGSMIVRHTLRVHAVCPVDGSRDEYECSVWFDRVVECEQLVADTAAFASQAIYQETLTRELANLWQATVLTTGIHAGGRVETQVRAFPRTTITTNPTGI